MEMKMDNPSNQQDILNTIENGILHLQFNRPHKKNAITQVMYQSLADALVAAEDDTQVRVIVISGSPDIFTAGNDLEDFMKSAHLLSQTEVKPSIFQFMDALNACGKPVIAAVCGAAVGIGTTMLQHCDLVYFAENAKLSMPFTQLGLCPEYASSLVLPQLMGYHRAAEKLLLGESFTAQEALASGFGNRILPNEECLAYAMQQAAKIVALPASSIRITKRLLKQEQVAAVASTMAVENKHFGAMLTAPEAREAFMAFFQKRKPDFSQFD
jgi:enoyl-CoA hydratase/carnithine racemase